MTKPQMIEGTYYIVIGKTSSYYPSLTQPKITKNKPAIPKGKIAIKLKLKFPTAIFDEFIPEGTITLPEDASVGRPQVEVRVPKDLRIDHKIQLALVEYDPQDDPQEPPNGQ